MRQKEYEVTHLEYKENVMELTGNIMGREWNINLVYNLPEEVNGRTCFPERFIEVREDFDTHVLEHILTHEVTHAFMFECGFQQLHERDIQMSQEFFCEFMAIHGKDVIEVVDSLMDLIKGVQNKSITV